VALTGAAWPDLLVALALVILLLRLALRVIAAARAELHG
jgi:Co/Zn/Cd efflux system component